jgi:hypothetical protein
MTFRQVNNLFLCGVKKDITSNSQSFSTSVIVNKSRHSSSDVKKAEEARTLMKRLGFPSNASLVNLPLVVASTTPLVVPLMSIERKESSALTSHH